MKDKDPQKVMMQMFQEFESAIWEDEKHPGYVTGLRAVVKKWRKLLGIPDEDDD